MKKCEKSNRLALRVLSTATFLAMIASCAAPAFAGTYYLENGSLTISATDSLTIRNDDKSEGTGNLEATGSNGGAGIGGGCDGGKGSNIFISGSSCVTAKGGKGANFRGNIVNGTGADIGNGNVYAAGEKINGEEILPDYAGLTNGRILYLDQQDGHQVKILHNRGGCVWDEGVIIKEPALTETGLRRHKCILEKDCSDPTCQEVWDEVLPKLTPEEPNTPDNTGSSDTTPSTPVQDETLDVVVTPIADDTDDDASVAPADAESPVQDAAPDAAVTPANAQSPVQNASALPQTGVNWLTALCTALSGLALLAAGFITDRKGRKQN